ncbi:tRNA (guanine(37)-N1)-methyltransferase 2 [Citrus sinensis]|nr:tRNA (guanine(37)-N1)-methyltransferase 2 [Citrus sinensis]
MLMRKSARPWTDQILSPTFVLSTVTRTTGVGIVDAGFRFSSFYGQDFCPINFFTTRRSSREASSPEVPTHTDKSEYAGCFPGANPPTLKSDMKASPESQSSAFFETVWDSDCCVMSKRGILRVTPRFWGKRGCRGSVRSCVLRHGSGESVAVVEIGLGDDVLVGEQDISSPVPPLPRAPGFYGTYRFAELCHQISAHHAWSRRRISPKQFRNLARISRPRRKKRKEKKEGKEGNGRKGELYVVEVVEEERKEMSGLLGDEFRGGEKWRGSTRLQPLLSLRMALKYSVSPSIPCSGSTVGKVYHWSHLYGRGTECFQLEVCNVDEAFDFHSYVQILEALLPKGMIIPSAFETVGHIAHLNLREEHQPFKYLIAKVVLDKNKPKIQTVVNKIDAIHIDYRTMQLEVLAGNNSLVTMLVENGLRFNVDLATVYWNSKLATERQRLLSGFNFKDVVCDVFAGVGPISIPAAKIVKRVYANDLNPYAVDYLERNSVLNKLEKKIEVFNMDGRRFIDAMFASQKAHKITQVVMNLPNDATEFLDAFRGIYRDRPEDVKFTFPKTHVYGFSKARDPEFDFHERIRIALAEVAVNVEMRRVRLVAPGKWMLFASFVLPESVVFARRSPNT